MNQHNLDYADTRFYLNLDYVDFIQISEPLTGMWKWLLVLIENLKANDVNIPKSKLEKL